MRRGFQSGTRFGLGRESQDPEVSLVALIDVLLVVIIFLLLTTTYARWSWLPLELPGTQAPSHAMPGSIEAAVLRDGSLRVGEKQLAGGADLKEVLGALQMAKNRSGAAAGAEALDPSALDGKALDRTALDPSALDRTLLIYADRNAPHGAVVHLMDAARAAGFSRVAFVGRRQ